MVNCGELVIAAAVVVEKFERRIAVGAKKQDRRRPRMSVVRQWNKNLCGWLAGRVLLPLLHCTALLALSAAKRGRLVPTLEFEGAHSKSAKFVSPTS